MKKLYGAFDLHSSNNYLGISDEKDRRVYKKRLPNQPDVILAELEPYREQLVGLVVESTFNWYWLVDVLMEEGYRLHLANPSSIQKYKGIKHSDDKHDTFWLAHLLRLGILPEGYIYPKEERPVRDLLRKRGHLVKLRTSLINSLQGIIHRNCGIKLNARNIKAIRKNNVAPLLSGQEDLALSGMVSKEAIDYLGQQIRKVENVVLDKIKLKKQYIYLLTIPGIGKILALTIMLEVGPIGRFSNVGNLASYCRKVPSMWTSNDKKKGKGNKKNGNRYLAWAFSEAAEFARRYDQNARAFYNRKASKKNFMVAHSALAHKLTRAAYYVMRDQVEFDSQKLFA
jgi:transposase